MEAQDDQARLDRLPKHAREEIIRLRKTVDSLRHALRTGPEDSNAFLNPYSASPTPLGKDPMILFRTGSELEGFAVQFKGDELLVMAPAYDDYLGVFPMSGNYVSIKHIKKG